MVVMQCHKPPIYMFIPPIYGTIGVYFTIALLTLNHWQYDCIYEDVCKIRLHRISMIHKEFLFVHIVNDTLWLFNIAMENDPFIDGLPIKTGGSFHGYVE